MLIEVKQARKQSIPATATNLMSCCCVTQPMTFSIRTPRG
jgi:hypothetical protein